MRKKKMRKRKNEKEIKRKSICMRKKEKKKM
jgi:hypothetical protein